MVCSSIFFVKATFLLSYLRPDSANSKEKAIFGYLYRDLQDPVARQLCGSLRLSAVPVSHIVVCGCPRAQAQWFGILQSYNTPTLSITPSWHLPSQSRWASRRCRSLHIYKIAFIQTSSTSSVMPSTRRCSCMRSMPFVRPV